MHFLQCVHSQSHSPFNLDMSLNTSIGRLTRILGDYPELLNQRSELECRFCLLPSSSAPSLNSTSLTVEHKSACQTHMPCYHHSRKWQQDILTPPQKLATCTHPERELQSFTKEYHALWYGGPGCHPSFNSSGRRSTSSTLQKAVVQSWAHQTKNLYQERGYFPDHYLSSFLTCLPWQSYGVLRRHPFWEPTQRLQIS